VAGGGGKGMRVVGMPVDLPAAVRAARSESGSSFGDSRIYLERRLIRPRHVEVQLIGDHHGTIVPFVERECSIQRRHQKVLEEAPCGAVTPEIRAGLAANAAALARSVGYTNAGTLEFLLDEDGQFYFLEMNTRLQVEHPVTEMVTGFDLVQWQIRVATGEQLSIDPARALTPKGHAIECRIYAEDPDLGFMPSPGLVRGLSAPGGPGVRDDRGVDPGFEIPLFYDSMISKLSVWGETRAAAIARLRRALDEYRVLGVKTTLPFFRWLIAQPAFTEGRFHTAYLDGVLAERAGQTFVEASERDAHDAAIAVALVAWRKADRAAAATPTATIGAWRRAARDEGVR
jgi:acetyl-CoA carboxylase biotin carboxylase subunit